MIDGCTITGNACSVDSGGNYEGGGIFVWHSYDVALRGLCVIKGNTRGKGGSADDIMLRENAGSTAKAYIKGTLAKGSSVGVRTGTTGDRRIAKNFKPETKNCLFYDMDGYYVSYGTDDGGDAWQRHRSLEFAVKLDGAVYGKYRNGTTVALAAPKTKDSKVFWRWDTSSSANTGLYPVADYFTEKNLFSNALTFTMPQNDVELSPVYVDQVKSALIAVEAPEAGKALSTSGQLVRTDGGASGSATTFCSVYWYEVSENGEKTLAAGVAKANTTYEAYVSAPEVTAYGLFYSESIGAGDVTVRFVSASGNTDTKPQDVYVTLSNSLATRTATYTTGGEKGEGTKAGKVEVQLKNKGLIGEGEAATAAAELEDAEAQADNNLIDTVEISYSYDEETDTVAIAAPEKEGYNFCNWDVDGDAEVSDEGVVSVPVSELLKIKSLTATYTPVATSLEVELEAPVADKTLAATCADITATCSDGETVSLATGFGAKSFEVTWSPESENSKANYSTAYAALIKITSETGYEDVEKDLAKGATVTCNGVAATSTGFAIDGDGSLCLAVAFPATRDAKVLSVAQPDAVELTFDEAKTYAEQGGWPLPKIVNVTLENGETADGDITWESVEGFNANATGAQELTVKGKVTHIAYEGNFDDSDASLDVTTTVKIAAPSQSENKVDNGTTNATNNKSGATNTNKSATVKTGDSISALAVAAVGAIAAIAIAAAAVATLRRKRS